MNSKLRTPFVMKLISKWYDYQGLLGSSPLKMNQMYSSEPNSHQEVSMPVVYSHWIVQITYKPLHLFYFDHISCSRWCEAVSAHFVAYNFITSKNGSGKVELLIILCSIRL